MIQLSIKWKMWPVTSHLNSAFTTHSSYDRCGYICGCSHDHHHHHLEMEHSGNIPPIISSVSLHNKNIPISVTRTVAWCCHGILAPHQGVMRCRYQGKDTIELNPFQEEEQGLKWSNEAFLSFQATHNTWKRMDGRKTCKSFVWADDHSATVHTGHDMEDSR